MHLQQIQIKNLLSFKDTRFPLGAYTVVVGPNNAGKTNLLRILDMISKNVNLELLPLDRKHRLNPEDWSRIILTLRLDDIEAKMVFQCIFGQTEQLDIIPKTKTLDVAIFWDKQQVETSIPKFVAYVFSDDFIILSTESRTNSLFYSGLYPNEIGGVRAADFWEILTPEQVPKLVSGDSNSLQYTDLKDSKSFMVDMLNGRPFDSLGWQTVVRNLPMGVNYDPNSHIPLTLLMKKRKHQEIVPILSLGVVLNRIFEEGFTLIKEIYPDRKEISDALAALRNSHHSTYTNVLDKFEQITGGVQVLAEQNDSGTEQILFVENGKRYDIDDSASGYYALISILHLLLGKTSGLVAIDEPEVHLHPEMSSRLHNMFGEISLKDAHPDVVVVTHSPKFVTYRQVARIDRSKLIVVTRPDSVSRVHADIEDSKPRIPPHLFNPEIFFGRGSLLVEGPADYHVQRAISDFYRGLFEKHNIVLVNCLGKDNIPAHIDLHRRFMIPYHCMVDSDYDGSMECVTKLNGDLEDELRSIGLESVKTKEDYGVYSKMIEFLSTSKNEEWSGSGIWSAFKKAVRAAGGRVPPQPSANI